MKAKKLVGEIRNLQAPSPVVVQLVTLLNSPDADNQQILKLVKCDGILCGKLLAICNSAASGLSQRLGSVEEAVFHLGYQKVYQHVLSVGFGQGLSRSLPGYSIDDKELWRHSLLTAMIAESIQTSDRPMALEPSVAYTAGLLHDIGKVVLNRQLAPEYVAAIRQDIEKNGHSRIEAERAVLETDHAEVGACLLQSWKLPQTIVEAVANHHEPVVEPHPSPSLLVHLANTLAHELGSAPGWDAYAIRTDERALSVLGFDTNKIECLLLAAYGSLQRMEEMAAVA